MMHSLKVYLGQACSQSLRCEEAKRNVVSIISLNNAYSEGGGVRGDAAG